MAKQLRLNFMFTSFGKLFISGKNARGVLKVYALNGVKINRIKIGIVGKINIEADENGNPTTFEHPFYSSEEQIFNSSDLLASESDDEQIIEFAVPLASNLPTSVSLKEGSITYYLYATMEEQFQDGVVQNVNIESNISVVSLVDCNTIPKAGKEKIANTLPVTGCSCLQRQEPNDCLQISPRAYVPGDCIKINAVIFNAQNCPLCFVQVALVQKVKIKCEDRTVKVQHVVSETKHGSVMPQQVQVWHDEMLRIPPLPPTTYNKHLHVSYKLKLIPVKQNTDVVNATAILEVPVVIGNLPLEASLTYLNPLNHDHVMLPIPSPYRDYARGENSIQRIGSKFVPTYITYTTERAMENVELQ
ncbi:arrestin domain-containing protein 2-like [Homalodisca vitripennis]|uniref:arrestin domain-containing protein 2-like n=1 Tax=Homalodisca vitripennis TaxID=197043 RepID=UPI001EEA8EEC|nr:arrestin domain-containing protein 2-like [Homalodisca vitripennis]